jgi:hypothetical protein
MGEEGNTAHKGKAPPDKGKAPPDKGRGARNGQAILGSVTDSAACVVLRASVETFGPAGDAELNFNVKWPGTALAASSQLPDNCSAVQEANVGGIDDSGNLYLPVTYPVSTKRG